MRAKYILHSLTAMLATILAIGCASQPPKQASVSSEVSSVPSEAQVPARSESEPSELETASVSPSKEAQSTDALSQALLSQNLERIFKAATDSISRNSKDVRALNALGVYYYRSGKFPASLHYLQKAIQVDASVGALHNNLGLVHLAMGEQHLAILAFKKAIEIQPEDSMAAANLGAIYVQHFDYTKAQVPLEIAYEQSKNDLKVLNNYAIVAKELGKLDLAKGLYERALKISPSNKEVLYNYAVLLIDSMKKYSEGQSILRKLRFYGVPNELKNRVGLLERLAGSTK